MFIFSGQEKIIYLENGVTSFSVQSLYSTWKNWISSGTNSMFPQAFSTVGGDPVTTTKSVAPYYFIKNNWKIRPQESSHQLDVDGNLFVDGGIGNPFTATTGNYNVFINISTSNNSVLLTSSSSSSSSITGDLSRIERKINDLTALSL